MGIKMKSNHQDSRKGWAPNIFQRGIKKSTPDLGLEPRTSRLEVLRAIQLRQPGWLLLQGRRFIHITLHTILIAIAPSKGLFSAGHMYDETLRARRRFLLSSLRSISDNQVSQNSIRRAIQTHDGIPDQSTRASVISVVKFIKTEVEVELNYQIDYGHQNEVESSR